MYIERRRLPYRDYFRFIQFALGLYEGKEFLTGDALKGFDWKAFYRFAQKQTLVGVVFEGIQRLPQAVAPTPDLLLAWMGKSQMIYKKNIRMNEATATIYNKVREAGFRCCILKGQGNAVMYPNPHSRTSGDIDVWVNAGREDIRRLAVALTEGHGAVGNESLNHIQLTVDGIAVEVHSTPAIMSSPLYNRRLQNWLRKNADLQCSNMVSLPDGVGDIAVPTHAFNAIYQLYHLYHHYFYEGVGLRQVVDYYFVLANLPQNGQNFKVNTNSRDERDSRLFGYGCSNTECTEFTEGRLYGEENHPQIAQRTQNFKANTDSTNQTDKGDSPFVSSVGDNPLQRELKHLGLWKFAGAMMYVLHEVMGLTEEQMIAPMDKKRGEMLLDEILSGGNFGRYDKRSIFGNGAIAHNIQRLCRDARLAWYYPAEALSEPIYRVCHWWWRMKNNI